MRQIEKDTACLLQLEAPRGASIAAQHSNGRSNRSNTVPCWCYAVVAFLCSSEMQCRAFTGG